MTKEHHRPRLDVAVTRRTREVYWNPRRPLVTLRRRTLERLDVVKAKLVYKALHPDFEAELRELERQAVCIISPEAWADE